MSLSSSSVGSPHFAGPQSAPLFRFKKLTMNKLLPATLLALTAAFGVWVFGKPAEVMPTRTIGWVETGSPGDHAGL